MHTYVSISSPPSSLPIHRLIRFMNDFSTPTATRLFVRHANTEILLPIISVDYANIRKEMESGQVLYPEMPSLPFIDDKVYILNVP